MEEALLTAHEGEDIKKKIQTCLEDLIAHDFQRLIQVLYRMDIDEKVLKQKLAEDPDHAAGQVITNLIIERHLEKQRSRQQYRRSEDIPEEDRW